MGRKPKYSVEEKLNAVREYLDGNESMNSIAKHLNISFQSFKQWVTNYEAMGTDAFATSQKQALFQSRKRTGCCSIFSR